MGKVRHSASAETDLLEAWLYVAESSIEAADLRSWPTSTPYILFHFVDAESITIARVLHHARDVPSIGHWPRH